MEPAGGFSTLVDLVVCRPDPEVLGPAAAGLLARAGDFVFSSAEALAPIAVSTQEKRNVSVEVFFQGKKRKRDEDFSSIAAKKSIRDDPEYISGGAESQPVGSSIHTGSKKKKKKSSGRVKENQTKQSKTKEEREGSPRMCGSG